MVDNLVNTNESYYRYWAKTPKEFEGENRPYHLFPFHCLDVVAVADVWLTHSSVILTQVAQQIDCEPDLAKRVILFFIALHDLGKLDGRFQEFVPELRFRLQGDEFEVDEALDGERYDHGSYGYAHFCEEYFDSALLQAVAGHHGFCSDVDYDDNYADPELVAQDKQARREWIDFCLDWFQLPGFPQFEKIELLAGLCSVSDWIGSSITNYSQDPSINLTNYYQQTLPRAEQALFDTHILSVSQGAGFSFLFPGYQPRGIQTLLADMPVKAGLTLVESDTGAGKTEFALAYASILIANKLADGIVFGLPTQATANGLFDRVGQVAETLFPDCDVTLAHGKSKYLIPDQDGFLYRSSKRAFLGAMSVATIDQILMGVLPVKHQFIRSFGARKSVLIVDEVHSFSPYMYGLIDTVLKGQHQSFSSVILLSATLPHELKENLLKTYGGYLHSQEYPLITHVSLNGDSEEYYLPESATLKKQIQHIFWNASQAFKTGLLMTNEQCQQLISWAEQGAMVAVLCNTVREAQLACLHLRSITDIEVDTFHARYTFADRELIEKGILKKYGKRAARQGGILVATQVIEQSLDLDFDVMVSQIAPVEFLMQRMGRVWRHDRSEGNPDKLACRSRAIAAPLFITLVPSDVQIEQNLATAFSGTGYVYGNLRALKRTKEYLSQNSVVSFPSAYRDALKYVYQSDHYPHESQQLTEMAELYKEKSAGDFYAGQTQTRKCARPLSDVDPRAAMLTRDGDMSESVVLFKGKQLLHGGDFNEPLDRDRNTVSLTKKRAKGQRDDAYFCIKAQVGQDLIYSDIGVEEDTLREELAQLINQEE